MGSHNSDVKRAVFQLLHDFVAEVAVDADLHSGVQAGIFCEDIGQKRINKLLRSLQREGPARTASLICNSEQRFVTVATVVGISEKHAARRGQGHVFARAIEQPVAVSCSNWRIWAADGGLRAEDFLSGAREAAELCTSRN